MNRSQVRRLARDYASGRLEYDEYVRERGELIDGIVSGSIAIESTADSTSDFAPQRSLDERVRSTPLPLIIGAGVVIAIIWAFLAPPSQERDYERDPSAIEQSTGTRVSTARALVEEFLSTRDWSGESLAEFRDNWNALTANEQAEARSEPWFRRLAEALTEEINAHKALAEFDGSGVSTTTGKRLAAFGEFLGIGAEMPEPTPPDRGAAPTTVEPRALSASQWLAAQSDDDYTVQLFALGRLDLLERLMASHPEIPLYVLDFEGREPRYRMVHGAFASEDQARAAHRALPADLRSESTDPFMRRIGTLRDELRAPPAPAALAPAAPAATDAAPKYTLQLFASSNRENIDRLVDRYPALDLRVSTVDGETARYRVLFGRFDSPEAAQAASAELPATMLEEVGTPLLRETSEFTGEAAP
jgi:cell division septation protein DedD